MDRLFKWNMLTTSFIPLWLSITVIVLWDIFSSKCKSFRCTVIDNWFSFGFIALIIVITAIGIISVLLFFKRKGKPHESSCVGRVLSARKSTNLVTDFLLAYILPMTAFNFTEKRDVILFLIYFGLIAYLGMRNGNVYTNILFEFMGFKTFICEIERTVVGEKFCYSDCIVISKESLTNRVGQEFPFYDFDNNIYINTRWGNNK